MVRVIDTSARFLLGNAEFDRVIGYSLMCRTDINLGSQRFYNHSDMEFRCPRCQIEFPDQIGLFNHLEIGCRKPIHATTTAQCSGMNI